jgi:hypothetical protein
MVVYIITMYTTIQISPKLRDALSLRKMNKSETYESVVWDLLEDSMELSEETKKDIIKSRKQAVEGKIKSLAQVKKELNL